MAQPNATVPVLTSRIGKRPLDLPKGVTLSLMAPNKVQVKGPKGTLTRTIPANVHVAKDGERVLVTSDAPGRNAPRLQGLVRVLLGNMVQGVAEGYEKQLQLVGTGYRAELKGKIMHLALGFSHPVTFTMPDGLTCEIPKESKGQAVILRGPDKEVVGQAAATIRHYRPPEPYSGKGVRYKDEKVREKAGKAGK